MTKSHRKFFMAAFLVAFSGQAIAECEAPSAPIIPDGNVASMDELISAQNALKAFQSSVLDYRSCLQALDEAIDAEADDAVARRTNILESYNTSVDHETALAEEFNGAVRAYKARQPVEAE